MINFIKNKKIIILLSLIVIIGAYFRLYRFGDLVRFNTDQVRDVEVVENILEGKEFPLLGPKAGGTLFKLGPAFYYLEAFSGFIFGDTPSRMALFVMILAVASIPLLFFFLRYYFSIYISLLLTLIYSFSFYAIKYSRFAWNPNIIPFFFILFLISLLKFIESKNEKFGGWHILLAISLGIGIQLHTLLLILMPLLFLLACAYIFFKEKRAHFLNFIIILFAVLVLNFPFFIYDFQNEGKNLKSFFSGTEKKTQKNSSLAENILKDGQFFIQGNTYAISSFEPQKNWITVKKLLQSKNIGEITAAFAGTLFGLFGFFYLVKNFMTERDEKKRIFLGSVLTTTCLSFLILLPIANELNVRYFIILIFLPYIFLGFFIEFLLKNIWKRLAFFIVLISFLFLAILNLRTCAKTYNLENYTARTSSYGGISVKEVRDISNFILRLSKDDSLNGKKFFIDDFEFNKSL
ncbi:MAG: glycosyltransferase family 39 protein, partial [bacterium]|nr:glycosyltransferase family 39 protein [bacterium]